MSLLRRGLLRLLLRYLCWLLRRDVLTGRESVRVLGRMHGLRRSQGRLEAGEGHLLLRLLRLLRLLLLRLRRLRLLGLRLRWCLLTQVSRSV